jgi:hypothetical protein
MAKNRINKLNNMNNQYKDYDPEEYKGIGITYTITVLEAEIKQLEKVKPFLSDKAAKRIEAQILELKNNISFLRQYR